MTQLWCNVPKKLVTQVCSVLKPAVTLVTYGGAMDIGKEVWSSSDRIIIMGDQKNAGIYAVCLYNHVLDFD